MKRFSYMEPPEWLIIDPNNKPLGTRPPVPPVKPRAPQKPATKPRRPIEGKMTWAHHKGVTRSFDSRSEACRFCCVSPSLTGSIRDKLNQGAYWQFSTGGVIWQDGSEVPEFLRSEE